MVKSITCKICNAKLEGEHKNGKVMKKFYAHLKQHHDIDYKTYYDKYLKIENEDKCRQCGKESIFINNCRGYLGVCKDCFEESKISCKICNKEYFGIGGLSKRHLKLHIKRKHSLNFKEYYDKYLKIKKDGICQVCGLPTNFNSRNRGYKTYCSKRCETLSHIETSINTIKKLNNDLDFQVKRNKAVRKKALERLKDPNDKFSHYNGARYSYNGNIFRSSWELCFAKLLDESSIEWKYEPNNFVLNYEFNGKKRGYYTPDFYLVNKDIWIEIKPKRLMTKWYVGLKECFKEKTNNELIFLDKKDFKDFVNNL